jgi:hypothetical protein
MTGSGGKGPLANPHSRPISQGRQFIGQLTLEVIRFLIPHRLVFGCHQELFQLLVFRRSSEGIREVGGSMIGLCRCRRLGTDTAAAASRSRH